MAFDGRKFVREMMCRPVSFTGYLDRVIDGNKRYWERLTIEERDGWVVGVTFLKTGRRISGSGGYGGVFGDYDDYEPPTFKETAPRQLVYLVSPWPTLKALYVPPDDVVLIPDDKLHTFKPSGRDARFRESSSEWAQSYERDKKGRFV